MQFSEPSSRAVSPRRRSSEALPRLKPLLAAVALVVGVSLAASACALPPRGPSTVAQGQAYKTGDPKYDGFFSALHDLQVELATAPERSKSLRADMAEYLELDDDASLALTLKKLESEVETFVTAGTGFSFELEIGDADQDSEIRGAVKGKPNPDAEAFLKAIRSSVLPAAELAAAMGAAESSIDRLEAELPELKAGVDQAFGGKGPGTRAEISKNLEDAGKLLSLMRERSKTVGTQAGSLAERVAKLMQSEDRVPAPAPPPSDIEVVEPPKGGTDVEVVE